MKVLAYARLLMFVLSPILFFQPGLSAETGNRPEGIRVFFQHGQYDLAISTAHEILSKPNVPDQERYELLLILARAEEKLAEQRHYTHVETAIRAYEALHKEFPKEFTSGKTQWKIASLSWNSHDFERADVAAQSILQENPRGPETGKAALLHARHLIRKERFSTARSILLRYFGLNPNVNAAEEAEGLVWLAVINEREHRNRMAYKTMQKIYAVHPDIIEGNVLVYATYIHLLARYATPEILLPHINRFVKRYIATQEAPKIRLLQADTLAAQGRTRDAETVYGILADRHWDSSIGKKAFMRQLMLKLQGSRDKALLNKAIATLSIRASKNQLSGIETEAQLDQAKLWARLGRFDPKYSDRALAFYALAASAEHTGFAAPAQKDGSILLTKRLNELLARRRWLKAVVLWKRYPQLRPEKSDRLSFDIAHAYMRLMDNAHAEEILTALYKRARGTVWGQRIMLERARIWVDRNDADSVKKIMRWLSNHEQTLYRQDMLLIAAEAQIKSGSASTARQTLSGIAPEDLAPALRHDYWLTRARIYLALQRWHTAADAWRHLASLSENAEKWRYFYARADAMIKNKNYAGAEKVLLRIPGDARHDAWHFSMALCAQNTGRWKAAEEQLIPLSKGLPNGNYTLRARLLLSEKHAQQVMMEAP